MRYVLDFGSANAGGAPTFSLFVRLDTLAALPQPAIVEIGGGQYYFDVDWSTTSATSISFKASLAGIELSDVISSPSLASLGTATASAAVSSLTGYSTVGTIINDAAVDCGLSSVADPYASTDANFVQFRRFLNDLGMDLAAKLKAHLHREFTLVTAGSATSYALPADFLEFVDQSGWDRSGIRALAGPVSPQVTQYLKAWNTDVVTNLPFRLQGNRITFPIAPADGLTIAAEYVSRYWIQTAASGTGPDADHATASTDYVLFDPVLVTRGLKLKWSAAKGFDTALLYAEYQDRLQYVRGLVGGAPKLSISRGGSFERFIDEFNAPITGYGA